MDGLTAIVPARGGSKGIPRKNIAPIAGKPLIAWTIEAGLAASLVSRVVVSTEDEEIANIAKDWGAEVPFMRPVELALDTTPGTPVILHALDRLESQGEIGSDYVLVLQPTSPLRIAQDIDGAIRFARERNADTVVSMCEAFSHPYWTKSVEDDGTIRDFLPLKVDDLRRQALPPCYIPNGAVYLARPEIVRVRQEWYTDRSYAYIMPKERSLDIDTLWDLYLADLVLRNRYNHERH